MYNKRDIKGHGSLIYHLVLSLFMNLSYRLDSCTCCIVEKSGTQKFVLRDLYVQIESSETSHSQCLGVVGYVIFTVSLCLHVSCPCSYEWASTDGWVRGLSTPTPKSGVETHEVDHNCVLKLIPMLHKQHWMSNSFMHIIYLANTWQISSEKLWKMQPNVNHMRRNKFDGKNTSYSYQTMHRPPCYVLNTFMEPTMNRGAQKWFLIFLDLQCRSYWILSIFITENSIRIKIKNCRKSVIALLVARPSMSVCAHTPRWSCNFHTYDAGAIVLWIFLPLETH
jgi:hypothetical protein